MFLGLVFYLFAVDIDVDYHCIPCDSHSFEDEIGDQSDQAFSEDLFSRIFESFSNEFDFGFDESSRVKKREVRFDWSIGYLVTLPFVYLASICIVHMQHGWIDWCALQGFQ